jgi:hypothetical protein
MKITQLNWNYFVREKIVQKGINNSDLLFQERRFTDLKDNQDIINLTSRFLSHDIDARLQVRYEIMKFSKNENQIQN